MDQYEYWRQMIAAIQQMAAEKEKNNFFPTKSSDFWSQMVDSVKENKDKILLQSNPFGNSLTQQFINSMLQKIEEENKNKLNLFEAALNKTKNLICELFKEIDRYVLADEIDTNMDKINEILDELIPELNKREEFMKLIRGLRKQ